MKKALSLIGTIIGLCIFLCGCCLSHDYAPATCEVPATCTKCGATKGDALGHSWNEATCTLPETCSVCGATNGTSLGHDYQWTVTKEATNLQEGTETGICSVCGDETTKSIEKLQPEFHWGIPVEYGTNSLMFYKEGDMYCFKMENAIMPSTELLSKISDGSISNTYLLAKQMGIVLKNYNSCAESNGLITATMEGYGRKWVVFLTPDDELPGIIGLKVNSKEEMQACFYDNILD